MSERTITIAPEGESLLPNLATLWRARLESIPESDFTRRVLGMQYRRPERAPAEKERPESAFSGDRPGSDFAQLTPYPPPSSAYPPPQSLLDEVAVGEAPPGGHGSVPVRLTLDDSSYAAGSVTPRMGPGGVRDRG